MHFGPGMLATQEWASLLDSSIPAELDSDIISCLPCLHLRPCSVLVVAQLGDPTRTTMYIH